MTIFMGTSEELQGPELWRRQCARNLMDCYALAMEGLAAAPGDKGLEALTRLMVDGMTSARGMEDERAFYRIAAGLCRECAAAEGRSFLRIYAAVFEDMAGEEDSNGSKSAV